MNLSSIVKLKSFFYNLTQTLLAVHVAYCFLCFKVREKGDDCYLDKAGEGTCTYHAYSALFDLMVRLYRLNNDVILIYLR